MSNHFRATTAGKTPDAVQAASPGQRSTQESFKTFYETLGVTVTEEGDDIQK